MSVQGRAAEEKLHRILVEHSRRYPRWAVEDLYKLVYQAAMGSEHAVQDVEAAREMLRNEMAALAPGMSEPLMEPISPDGRIVRIHLRPFMAARYDNQALADAFIRTSIHFKGSVEKLVQYGHYSARLAASRAFSFSAGEITGFFRSMEEQGYPAVHHSPLYKSNYSPAYRVIARKYLPEGLQDPSL